MMEKKKIITLFSLLVLAVFLSQIVAAQGIFEQSGMKPLRDAFSAQYAWPPFGTGTKQDIALGIVILTWIALFALLYVLTQLIPTFQGSTHKNAIMWFAFALAGIAVTSTGFVGMVAAWVDFTGTIFYVLGVVVIIFLAIGLLMRGTALGGQLGAGGAAEVAKAMGEADKTIQESNKVRREAHLERQSWDRENKAMQEADKLLNAGLTGATTIEKKLFALLKIIEQIRQISDVGEAARRKALFDQQASVVASNIAAVSKIAPHLSQLENKLEQMRNFDITIINRMKSHLGVLNGLGAARTPVQNAHLGALRNHLNNLESLENKRIGLLKGAETFTAGISTPAKHAQNLMEAVIRDVHDSNYPDAVANLNQLLSDIQTEVANIKKVKDLVKEMEQLLTNQTTILNAARPLLP